MIILPVSGPVAWGVNVTWMEQLELTATDAFTQLSVSLKLPLMEIEVGAKAMLPVFSRVTVSAVLVVSKAWLWKVSEAGFADAEVMPMPALHNEVCQRPRP